MSIKVSLIATTALALFLMCGSVFAQCPRDAVFVLSEGQIRGFSLRANGATVPCQVIRGPKTGLQMWGSIAVSKNGFLHVAQFLLARVDVFAPDANGDVAPSRSTQVFSNDFLSITTDASGNDFLASRRGPYIVYSPASGQLDTIVADLPSVGGIALDPHWDLLVGGSPGFPQDTKAAVLTYATSQNLDGPPVIRMIAGSATGLLSSSPGLALDPSTSELFVYNSDSKTAQVSVFAAEADGNVAPIRVIGGANTGISVAGYFPGSVPSANKIAVSSDGRLFVLGPNNRILVFAPGANGDVRPSQIIEDAGPVETLGTGIAVRSVDCAFVRRPPPGELGHDGR